MMLVRSSLPNSIDGGLSYASDHGQQEFLRVWIPHDGTWQEPIACGKHLQQVHSKAVPDTEHGNKDDNLCSRNFPSSTEQSTKANMPTASSHMFVYKRRKSQRNSTIADALPPSQSFTPTLVYKRRKVQNVFPAQVSTNTRASENYLSANNSEATSIAGKEHMVSLVPIDNGSLIAPVLRPVETNRLDLALNFGSIDSASLGREPIIEEEPKSKMLKALDLRTVNDSCSSSKSNMDVGSTSLKPQVDDVNECSSSGAPIMEGPGKDLSDKNTCISFLIHHGVVKGLIPTKPDRSEKPMGVKNDIFCLTSCKFCGQSVSTQTMLICDLCEKSFHVSCFNPPIKEVPVGEWFCPSCSRKKLKKLNEISSIRSPKDDLGPIAVMLREADAYTTKVRIGKDFQADVPDWSGPIADGLNDYGEPVEMSPSECASYQGWNTSNLSNFTAIGNWLKCRQVIDGVNGTICGKWRRAPLVEVQTDDWECFSSVLWDPTHADCAVPQELDTDQVFKHLKYIEMLRPRLSAKRWKLGC